MREQEENFKEKKFRMVVDERKEYLKKVSWKLENS